MSLVVTFVARFYSTKVAKLINNEECIMYNRTLIVFSVR